MAGRDLQRYIDEELREAERLTEMLDYRGAFRHLERAHVLGQALTREHTRVHWRMLKVGWRTRSWREVFGQLIRIVGAATKTPFGIYPTGNTGGANVWFFKRMPIPDDLQKILKAEDDVPPRSVTQN
jgi:hypothetical protein